MKSINIIVRIVSFRTFEGRGVRNDAAAKLAKQLACEVLVNVAHLRGSLPCRVEQEVLERVAPRRLRVALRRIHQHRLDRQATVVKMLIQKTAHA